MNYLLFGDNLKWLRDAKIFPDSSVDLVYLDPPFNSNVAVLNPDFRLHAKDKILSPFRHRLKIRLL